MGQAQGVPLDSLFQQECKRMPGTLFRDECYSMLLKYDPNLSAPVLTAAFRVFDWDSNGSIDLQEFIRAFSEQAKLPAAGAQQQQKVVVTIPAGFTTGMQFPFDFAGQRYYAIVS